MNFEHMTLSCIRPIIEMIQGAKLRSRSCLVTGKESDVMTRSPKGGAST